MTRDSGRPPAPPVAAPTLTRRAYLWRAGAWLSFLVIALTAPVIYLFDPPHAVAMGAVFGWGAVAGMVAAIAVTIAYAPMLALRGRAPGLATAFGMVVTGAFGGAGVAALIDGAWPIATVRVELPVVGLVRQPGRRSHVPMIETVRPIGPARSDRIPADTLDLPGVTIGGCLFATLVTGRLGGRWLEDWRMRRCSQRRGSPGPQVLIVEDGATGWRWHRPRPVPGGSPRSEQGAALPPVLRCIRQREGWLLSCQRMADVRRSTA